MGYKKRGLAIVINNKDFHPNTSKRMNEGMKIDM